MSNALMLAAIVILVPVYLSILVFCAVNGFYNARLHYVGKLTRAKSINTEENDGKRKE